MKVLFIITRANTIAGAQVYVKNLATALVKQGNQALVMTGARGIFNLALERQEIETIPCDFLKQPIHPWQDFQALYFIIKIVRTFQPDLVSAHSSKAGMLGRLACKLSNTPCIFTAHGWAFTEGVPEPSRTIYQGLERIAEPLAEQIICVSNSDRLIGLKAGMNPNKLRVIHNGVPDIPIQLKVNPDVSNPVRIVMVARFDQQKDHITLIYAFQNLSGAKLDLVGDGPKLEEVKRLVRQLGLTEKVNFIGYSERIAQLLSQVQIFTLISNWEGLPLTVIEAMRAGLPVVASDVGGVAEAVDDGLTGYCIPRNNVIVLHEQLSKLVNSSKLRSAMGIRGREKYESEFTFEQMFKKTEDLYIKVLKSQTDGKDPAN